MYSLHIYTDHNLYFIMKNKLKNLFIEARSRFKWFLNGFKELLLNSKYFAFMFFLFVLTFIILIATNINTRKINKRDSIYNDKNLEIIHSDDLYVYYKLDGEYYVLVQDVKITDEKTIREKLNISDDIKFNITYPNVLKVNE